MAYNNFTLDTLIQEFGLQIVSASGTLAHATPVAASTLLKEMLTKFMPLALNIGTDKSRSEFIIAPVLGGAWRKFEGAVSLFSGVDFTVDPEVSLGGVCDFLFSLSPLQLIVQAPVVAVVEAKNDNLKLGQCVAELKQRSGSTPGAAWNFRICMASSPLAACGNFCASPVQRL